MAGAAGVWGIDVGQCALKAIKLRPAGDGKLEVVAFDIIEHPKILSQPDADRDELISGALEKFASRNDWQGDKFVVGVPGQQTFARFCKMPPIDLKKDSKKINDLVKYEASQQIPFDMDDVVWDYQLFTAPESPDIEVGIFAIRKDLIRKHIEYFSNEKIAPMAVQTIPSALYNFCAFDGQSAESGATVMIDVGAQNTDLIIVEPNSAWTRNIPLGGNTFTEALVRAFKLSFAKAENLKRTAASSKYARQIFQTMRPVFAELVAEIQRSIGFYSQTHRDVALTKVLALGNAFRLTGLQRYLEQNLSISGGVHQLKKFEKLAPSATLNAPQFTDNVLSFGAAYGLALQGLGLARITANLLPPELARIAVWKKKRVFFAASAGALAAAAAVPFMFNLAAAQALTSSSAEQMRAQTQSIVGNASQLRTKFQQARADTGTKQAELDNIKKFIENKRIIPRIYALVYDAMPESDPRLLKANSAEELRKIIASDPARLERTQRNLLQIESLKIEYSPSIDFQNINAARNEDEANPIGTVMNVMGAPGGRGTVMPGPSAPPPPPGPGGAGETGGSGSGFMVTIRGRLQSGKTRQDASQWLTGNYAQNIRKLAAQPKLGFFIPDQEPGAKVELAKEWVSSAPKIENAFRHDAMTRGQNVTSGGAGRDNTPQFEYPDPLLGEESKFDWYIEFTFKVKLGEKPPSAEPAPGTPPAAPPEAPKAP